MVYQARRQNGFSQNKDNRKGRMDDCIQNEVRFI